MAVDTLRRDGKPRIWVTWVAKLLGGDSQCQWAAWYRARHVKYKKLPDSGGGDLATWRAVHDALMDTRSAELEKDGYRVLREREAEFELVGQTAVLAGKCDIVGVPEPGRPVLVVDGKGGTPKPADRWQVLQYLYALPLARKDIVKPPEEGRRAMAMSEVLRGEVKYKDDPTLHVPASDLTTEAVTKITHMVRLLGSDTPPPRTPTRSECRFCNIADCNDRYTGGAAEAKPETADF